MKTKMFIILAALVASVTLSRAEIIGHTLAADGDGVVTCNIYDLINTSTDNYRLDIYGDHNVWAPGHILGDILTDTEVDPTLAFYQSIDNDTAFAWGDYHVKVTMNKSFTFSNVGVVNSGWTFAPVATPTMVGTNWIGYIDYYAGTPVIVGGTLNFNYAVSFVGSVQFCEELTPSAVPEPGTFALVACGLAGLLVLRRRSAS
jgi:hypothetical protein